MARLLFPSQRAAGPHTWMENLPLCVHAGTPRFAHQQALGVWGQGAWVVFLFWESKYASDLLQQRVTEDMFGLALWCSNIYKFSFFCQLVLQPSSCLSAQEGSLVSTRAIWKLFLYFFLYTVESKTVKVWPNIQNLWHHAMYQINISGLYEIRGVSDLS